MASYLLVPIYGCAFFDEASTEAFLGNVIFEWTNDRWSRWADWWSAAAYASQTIPEPMMPFVGLLMEDMGTMLWSDGERYGDPEIELDREITRILHMEMDRQTEGIQEIHLSDLSQGRLIQEIEEKQTPLKIIFEANGEDEGAEVAQVLFGIEPIEGMDPIVSIPIKYKNLVELFGEPPPPRSFMR